MDLNRYIKKRCKWQKNKLKDAQHYQPSEKKPIKTTVRYHFMLSRMMSKRQPVGSSGEDVEKLESSQTTGWNVKQCSNFGKVWQLLKRLSIELPYYPAILLLGIYLRHVKNIGPHKNMCMYVQSHTVHNSQKVKQPKCL